MNAYQDLGLSNFASVQEIKKAHRTMALKHHIDRGGDEEKMKIINRAYEFLTKHKAQYDLQLRVQERPIIVNTGWRYYNFGFTTATTTTGTGATWG